ncbi:MAG: hypothetical protein ACT4O1_17710 [Gemmatimonadota bacterium]
MRDTQIAFTRGHGTNYEAAIGTACHAMRQFIDANVDARERDAGLRVYDPADDAAGGLSFNARWNEKR